EHLYEMDYLKEGIGLRAMAQRDPLIEYEREGHLMFNDMIAGIKEDAVGYLYNLEVKVQQPAAVVPESVTKLVASAGGAVRAAATAAATAATAPDGPEAERTGDAAGA